MNSTKHPPREAGEMTMSTAQAKAVIHSTAGNEKWFLMAADAERCKAKITSQKGDKNQKPQIFQDEDLKGLSTV